MIKKDVVLYFLNNTINKYNLLKGDYIVTWGAAMVLRDIRETCNDIDITLTCEAYDRIRNDNLKDEINYNGDPNHLCIRKIIVPSHESTHIDMFRGSYGMLTTPSGTEMQNGLIVQTLVSLRNEKFKRGREKDMNDVDLLNDAIRKSTKTYTI